MIEVPRADHEDLPRRAPANSAVVTTAARFAITLSSSIACTSGMSVTVHLVMLILLSAILLFSTLLI
jgi:hypothetical protein